MRRRIGVGAAVCAGALALGAGISQAGIATSIEKIDSGYNGSSLERTWLVGRVGSNSPKCIANRKVSVSYKYISEDQFRPVDSGRTNKSGMFSAIGPTTHGAAMNQVDTFRILVKAKNVGKKTCASDQEEFGAG
jgi:hypothetical protein